MPKFLKLTENPVNFLIYFLLYTHICYLFNSFIMLQWIIDLRYVQCILSGRSMFQNLLQLYARKDMLSLVSVKITHESTNNLKCVHMLTAFFHTQYLHIASVLTNSNHRWKGNCFEVQSPLKFASFNLHQSLHHIINTSVFKVPSKILTLKYKIISSP